ncbi:sensor histidine kinase [Nocardioides aurantiacus]|uniref:Sensor-like histidine kinase SenX3 n=1 Tax=Nocardioides aurantiacus TaxID=86796 RepID=A0A3N2CSC1_9ACTN|nr:GAF domain-containing sensor histidine kinase [Nocardioides aurantiacus]ROR90425.1 GAF sensor signal transduction histidine kinase [Nocardioides aurantiacus]
MHDAGKAPSRAAVDRVRDAQVDAYRVAGLPRAELTDLARLAAQLAGVPAAAVNLMRAGDQTTVAAYGTGTEVCDREDAMCAAILYDGHPVRVADASADPRWADNPYVTGERNSFRFYCAHQLVTPDGVVFGTLCVFDHVPRDITDEVDDLLGDLAHRVVDLLELRVRTRQLEDAVRDLTETRGQLERSNERLSLFAAQVAHDLKGPLASLSFALGVLDDHDGSVAPEDAWLVARARGSVNRMDGLIGDILRFATVQGGVLVDEVDLADLVREVCVDLALQLQRVEVVMGDLPVVSGDRTQLRLVVQNLVANAARFTRDRGDALVRVSAGHGEDAGRAGRRGWWLEVGDNGPGVPDEDRERVFELMVQGTSSDGLGIGLATARRLVEAHGGTVRIGDSPEGGALLRIEVPAG